MGDTPSDIAAALVFASRAADLQALLEIVRSNLQPDGFIWVSWPKKSSGVATDLTDDRIREIALPMKLVDVKVCAVTEIWSGLKLVIPVKDRG